MKVYFSGISGTGIGPLAEFAQDAGFEVIGSDLKRGAIASELDDRAIPVHYGPQDGEFLRQICADTGKDGGGAGHPLSGGAHPEPGGGAGRAHARHHLRTVS